MTYTEVLQSQVYDFILVFARISAIVAFAPVFGARSVPTRSKAFIAFTLAVAFTAFLTPLEVQTSETGAGLILQLAGEAVIGAAIGFAASLIFEIIIFAGYIMDYMIGFGFINVVDPQSGTSISLFSFFYSFLGLILFLAVDAHHILIEAMLRGYDLIPVFGGQINEIGLEYITRMTGAIFYTGFQLAAPIFIVMFMVDFTLGVAAKTVPQIQILVVGFPLKIGIGLIIIALAMGPIARFIIHMMENYRDSLMWLFKYWGSGP